MVETLEGGSIMNNMKKSSLWMFTLALLFVVRMGTTTETTATETNKQPLRFITVAENYHSSTDQSHSKETAVDFRDTVERTF